MEETKGVTDRKTFTSRKFDFLDALAVDPEATHLDFRLSYQLLHYVNGITRTAWPGAPRLAQEIGADIRSVRRSLKRLTEGSSPWWIKDKKGRRGRATIYRPNFDKLQALETAEENAGRGAFESPTPGRNRHKTESKVTQTPGGGGLNVPGPSAFESPQHLKKHLKKHLSAPTPSPSPRKGEAQPSSLGEDLKNGARTANASPDTNTLNASNKAGRNLGVRVQIPDIGVGLRRQAKKAKARQKATTDLHAFLAISLGRDGYADWVAGATPEAEAMLAEQLKGAPSGGAGRRQRELRLLRMIEGGRSGDDGAVDGGLHHHVDGDDVEQQVAVAGGAA